jgi:hypothetical protein
MLCILSVHTFGILYSLLASNKLRLVLVLEILIDPDLGCFGSEFSDVTFL